MTTCSDYLVQKQHEQTSFILHPGPNTRFLFKMIKQQVFGATLGASSFDEPFFELALRFPTRVGSYTCVNPNPNPIFYPNLNPEVEQLLLLAAP